MTLSRAWPHIIAVATLLILMFVAYRVGGLIADQQELNEAQAEVIEAQDEVIAHQREAAEARERSAERSERLASELQRSVQSGVVCVLGQIAGREQVERPPDELVTEACRIFLEGSDIGG